MLHIPNSLKRSSPSSSFASAPGSQGKRQSLVQGFLPTAERPAHQQQGPCPPSYQDQLLGGLSLPGSPAAFGQQQPMHCTTGGKSATLALSGLLSGSLPAVGWRERAL
jgi:hypothetical protein